MSIEYFLYSSDPRPVLVDELITDLASVGWAAVVVRDLENWATYSVIDSGALADADLIVAHEKDEGAGIESVHAKNKVQTEALLTAGILASCLVYSWVPYSAEKDLDDAEIREELIECYGKPYMEARLKSNARFGTRTSSGRSATAIHLQIAVTKSLCRLRGGLFEDEMSGSSQMVSPGQEPANIQW